MMRKVWWRRRGLLVAFGVLVLLGLLGWLVVSQGWLGPVVVVALNMTGQLPPPVPVAPAPEEETAGTYFVEPHRVETIAPGTVIGDSLPEGYTHLIIKIRPRPGAGDVEKLSSGMRQAGDLFFIAVLAQVKSEDGGRQPRYRLGRVNAGYGTTIDRKDTIITAETQAGLGAKLGVFGGVLLSVNESRLKAVQITVWSDTMAIIDVPLRVLRDGTPRPGVRRYAVLVDRRTGDLETLLWFVDQRAEPAESVGPLRLLPPGLHEDAVLHVDGSQLGFVGLPSEKAFALVRLPAGKKDVPLHPDWKDLSAISQFTEEEAGKLEKGLRKAMAEAAPH